ncbi:hypothetical protein FUAX_05690 [Fulvitalea axinellae]|uniref:Uncharacterized protein n=1 Tax=Fulvitalea axinellae TaxID=1182444 RepID=A0AAU9CS14_9BACT|nr:hypothetical protein FUAX_05690 [Fulvitalea axinellae]
MNEFLQTKNDEDLRVVTLEGHRAKHRRLDAILEFTPDTVAFYMSFYGNRSRHWTIRLGDKLEWSAWGRRKRIIDPKEVVTFLYEVGLAGRRGRYTGNVTVFAVLKGDPEPKEFFTLYGEASLNGPWSQQMHALAKECLNVFRTRYRIPYEYRTKVETQKREKIEKAGCWVTAVLFVGLFGIIIWVMWLDIFS